jgi:hypothetical protein
MSIIKVDDVNYVRLQVSAIDEALHDAVASKAVTGVVAMAANRKGIIYEGAFGVADIPSAQPMKVDTIFRIASMTKAVTSTALMQLVEQGKVAIEDPLAKPHHCTGNLGCFPFRRMARAVSTRGVFGRPAGRRSARGLPTRS